MRRNTRREVLRYAGVAGGVGLVGCMEETTTPDDNESDGGDGGADGNQTEDGGDGEDGFQAGEPYEAVQSIADGDWPVFSFDDRNTSFNPHADGPSELESDVVMEVRLPVTKGVSYVEDKLFVNDGFEDMGTVYGFDAEAGEALWMYEHGDRVRAAPAVTESTVYAVGYNDVLFALDASDGEFRWSEEIGRSSEFSSPTVADGSVYVGSSEGLHAFGAYGGGERWVFDGGGVNSTAAVDDGVVFVGSNDNSVYAVDAESGDEIWSFETGGRVLSSPTLEGGVVYAGSRDGGLYAIEAETGDAVWSEPFTVDNWIESSPAVADGVVYFGSWDQNVYAVDAESGESAWESPVETDDRVIDPVAVAGGTVYVTPLGTDLYVVDAADGTVEQVVDLDALVEDDVSSSGSPVPVGDAVYVGAGQHVHALR